MNTLKILLQNIWLQQTRAIDYMSMVRQVSRMFYHRERVCPKTENFCRAT